MVAATHRIQDSFTHGNKHTLTLTLSRDSKAIASVAAAINAGFYSIGLAGGVETMSTNAMAWEGGINPRMGEFPAAAGCLMPMGVTSENVAEKFGIDRATQVCVGGGRRSRAQLTRALFAHTL